MTDKDYSGCEFYIKGSQYVNGEYLCYAQTNSKKHHKEKFCKDNTNCYYKQNQQLKAELKPFKDVYFKGLYFEDIAELAKKSIRLTANNIECENTALRMIERAGEWQAKYLDTQNKSNSYKEALKEIMSNEKFLCRFRIDNCFDCKHKAKCIYTIAKQALTKIESEE